MTKEDTIKFEGAVEELLPNMTFRVKLKNGMVVMAYLCGKMRMKNIEVIVGDKRNGGNVPVRFDQSENHIPPKAHQIGA